MARKKQLSKEKRVAIITIRNECQSVWKIGKTLKVSPSAVAKTIKRYKETGSHEDHPRKGRPRVTSAAQDKFIRVTSLRNRTLTANTVSLPTRQMCDAWPRIPGVNFRRKMGTFFVVFQRGVRQIDIHVIPFASDIDERKSMSINGDVAIVYWFVWQIHH